MPESVGIRKLQQHASSVVDRARAGEIIEITDHGRPVAQIGPVRQSRLESLTEAGLADPATMSINDLPPPLPPLERSLGDILAEMREDER
jgi:prevent-host-death family protein